MLEQWSIREALCSRVRFRGPVLGSLIAREFAPAWVLLPVGLGRRVSEISPDSPEISDPRAVLVRSRVRLLVIDAAEQGISKLIAERKLAMVVARWVIWFVTVPGSQVVLEVPDLILISSRGAAISVHSNRGRQAQFRLLMRFLPDLRTSSRGRVGFSRVLRPRAEFFPFQRHRHPQCSSSQSPPW